MIRRSILQCEFRRASFAASSKRITSRRGAKTKLPSNFRRATSIWNSTHGSMHQSRQRTKRNLFGFPWLPEESFLRCWRLLWACISAVLIPPLRKPTARLRKPLGHRRCRNFGDLSSLIPVLYWLRWELPCSRNDCERVGKGVEIGTGKNNQTNNRLNLHNPVFQLHADWRGSSRL